MNCAPIANNLCEHCHYWSDEKWPKCITYVEDLSAQHEKIEELAA